VHSELLHFKRKKEVKRYDESERDSPWSFWELGAKWSQEAEKALKPPIPEQIR
jgi:hypothetical protein